MAFGKPWSKQEDDKLRERYPIEGPTMHILGRSLVSIRNRASKLGVKYGVETPIVVTEIPTANRDIKTLLDDRFTEFARKRLHHEAKKKVVIELKDDKPYGVLFYGDPHVDDPGSDLQALESAMAVGNSPSILNVNVGDLTNNWVGSLQRLYAHQTTTDDEAIELIEWMLTKIPWAFIVLGNHDKWGPIATLLCQKFNIPYASHGTRFTVETPKGRHLMVDCRHDHIGRSQYHPAHGAAKQNYRGNPSDIIISGHTHTGGHEIIKNGVADQTAHAVRIGAFKKYDDYADSKGYADESLGAAVLFVVDPQSEHEVDWLKPFYDLELGRDYLGWLRNR